MSRVGVDNLIVGRVIVGRHEARCCTCGQPFKFGRLGDPGVNVYSRDGMLEVGISGMCETCFDGLYGDDDEEEFDDEP